MRNLMKVFCFVIVLTLSLQACNINIDMSNPAPTMPPIALTITAQAAILAQGNQEPVSPATAQPTLDPSAATPTNAPESVDVAVTNTSAQSGPVTVKVTAETNCRSGPALTYKSLYSMSVSDVAEVIGKNTLTNYWIIKIPNGGGTTCWLWGQYAVVTGDTATLTEIATPTAQPGTATKAFTPTATATKASAPEVHAPSNFDVINKTCVDLGNGFTRYTGAVTWKDNSNNEGGFEVTMPGVSVGLGPNVTAYFFDVNLDTATYPMGSQLSVTVFAYGQDLTKPRALLLFSCP